MRIYSKQSKKAKYSKDFILEVFDYIQTLAAPECRAAANTAMGWKNSNLRTEMTRLLRRAGVSILAATVPYCKASRGAS